MNTLSCEFLGNASLENEKQNQDIFDLFQIDNLNTLTPNDIYLLVRTLFLTHEDDNIITIQRVQKMLLEGERYDEYFFFLKYCTITFEETESHFFRRELFEESQNLEEFLDNVSRNICSVLGDILNTIGLTGITFTTEHILVSPCSREKEGLFGFEQDVGEKLLYGLIRYFIVERGINFPDIKKIDNWKGYSFGEFDNGILDDIIELSAFSKGTKKEKIEEKTNLQYPSAKDFIIFCMENLSGINGTDEFSISNGIAAYLHDQVNSFSFEEFRQILITSVKCRNTSFHYMLKTEGSIVGKLIDGTQKMKVEEIEKLDIQSLEKIYIAGYIKHRMSWGDIFYLDTNNDTFYITRTSFQSMVQSVLIKEEALSSQDQVRFFLGSKKSVLSKLLQSLQSHVGNRDVVLHDGIIDINSKSKNHLLQQLVDIIHKGYSRIEHGNEVKSQRVNGTNASKISNIDGVISGIKQKHNKVISKGAELYNSLLFDYETSFFPVGGKVHFKDPLSKEKVRKLREEFLFTSTPFTLQHANTSMLLPPCKSPFQLVEVLKKLHDLGIINDGDLELQLSIAGRLPNEFAGILGSSMIFMKNYQISYPKEAFYTGFWDQFTKSCIVCYDAGVLIKEEFENISDEMSGRTDILGVRNIEEVVIFSVISNLVSQSYFGGPLKEQGQSFIDEYKKLLDKYNLFDILNKKWVHNPNDGKKDDDKGEYIGHYELVKRCTDILNSGISEFNNTGSKDSLIFELRELLGKYIKANKLIPSKISDTSLSGGVQIKIDKRK